MAFPFEHTCVYATQQLRGERLHERNEFEAQLRQRDEMLRAIEERMLRLNEQLSRPNFRELESQAASVSSCVDNGARDSIIGSWTIN